MLIKAIVSIAKTIACITATINSKHINGSGKPNAHIPDTVDITLSPANKFPNNLQDKEITFVNSPINSKNPTNINIGNILNVINLLI
jgi:hypothetical protein